jgi:hypothetical protein
MTAGASLVTRTVAGPALTSTTCGWIVVGNAAGAGSGEFLMALGESEQLGSEHSAPSWSWYLCRHEAVPVFPCRGVVALLSSSHSCAVSWLVITTVVLIAPLKVRHTRPALLPLIADHRLTPRTAAPSAPAR